MELIGGKTIWTKLSEQIDPTYTALLVIDVQDTPELWESEIGRPVLSNIRKLVDAAERACVQIVYLHNVWREGYLNLSPSYLAATVHSGGYDPSNPPSVAILANQNGSRIHPTLRPRSQDAVFQKCRASAFSGTPLDQWLRSNGVQTVICVGHAVDACVANTVWAAMNLDYYVVVGKDCVCGDRLAKDMNDSPAIKLFSHWFHVPTHLEIQETWQFKDAWRC